MNQEKASPPPKTFEVFSQSFPKIAQAWNLLGQAGLEGPLDEKTCRLLVLFSLLNSMQPITWHSGR